MKVEYTDWPMSMLVCFPVEDKSAASLSQAEIPRLWLWYPLEPRREQTEEIVNTLVTDGYKQAQEIERPFIATQLYDTCLLALPDEKPQLWYKPGEQQYVPVILCFPLPDTASYADESGIFMLNYLPPPQLGECAYVVENERMQAYQVLDLPPTAQHLREELDKRLRSLSTPGLWPAYTERHATASDPVAYQREINRLEIQRRLTSGRTRKQLMVQQAMLESASIGIRDLRISLQKADWTAQWGEIQHIAKRLAEAYWTLHQSQSPEIKKRTIPTIPDVFISGYASVPTPLTVQAIIDAQQNAASGGNKWERPEGHPPYYRHETKAGTTIVEYRQGESEILNDRATESLWAQVQEFTDLDIDVLLGMLGHMIRGPVDNSGSVWFFASNMLDYRGIQPIMKKDSPGGRKRRAGHRQEDIIEVGRCVSRASNLWITIDQFIHEEKGKKKQGKKKLYTHKGRLLSIDEVWYQHELDMGDIGLNFPIGWRIRAGSWLQTFLEQPNRQVAWLCQQVLRYDPYREQWEKRLGTYFFFHFRMNATGGGVFNREIGKLLSERSLPVDENRPQRTKDRFEKAMNRLKEDRQIDDWEYAEDVNYKSRGWIRTWLTARIKVYVAPSTKRIR